MSELKQKLLLSKIKSKINKAKVISFDIFDTLLVRPYIKPTDLFEHMERALDCKGFAFERKDAERRARVRHRELEDITFDMIYDEIDEEFKHLKQKEMDWEEMVLRPNPELKQVYDYAQKLGKKIIIVSDMYLPSKFLRRVLRKNGFKDFEKLYVSGELGKKKRTGALFKHVIDELDEIAPKQILHIGDNKVSDFEAPTRFLIKAIEYCSIVQQFGKDNKYMTRFDKNRIDASVLASMQALQSIKEKTNLKISYWENIGYRFTGPIALGFAYFLNQQIEEEKLNNLLFVARDGYLLQKVFNKINKNKIKNSYVYAPRILKLIVTLKCERDRLDKLSALTNFYVDKSSEIKEIFEKQKPTTCEEYCNFIENNKDKFLSLAEKYDEKCRKYFKKYISPNDKIGLVDTIAVFYSAQELIKRYCNKECLGLYFTQLRYLPYSKNKHKSYAAVCNEKNNNFWIKKDNVVTKSWEFVEFLISSPEHPIVDFNENIEPIFDKNPSLCERYRASVYPEICKGTLRFAQDFIDVFADNIIDIDFNTIVDLLNSFIMFPNEKDIEMMSNVAFNQLSGFSEDIPLFSKKFSLFDMIFKSKQTKEKISKLKWKTKNQKRYLKNWGIYEEKTPSIEIKRFFGVTLYKKRIEPNETRISKFFGLLKIKETSERKKKYFCGIKVSDKEKTLKLADLQKILVETNNRAINEIAKKIQRSITIAMLHQKTFGEFRNKHHNQTVVLIGAGPSVTSFEPIKNCTYLGLNRAFLLDKVKFNYLFSIDKMSLKNDKEDFYEAFSNYDAIKFVGDQNIGVDFQMPQSFMYSDEKIRRYKTTVRHINCAFPLEIDSEPLLNSTSVAIQAMQFILFTNPKKVYVVGIDCTLASKQHFVGSSWDVSKRNEDAVRNDRIHVEDWKRIKNFIRTYYPETEVVVINPVGLKGIFRDVYTKSYLQKHPEIDPETVEIFKQKEEEICV